jgi:hypothetical protein
MRNTSPNHEKINATISNLCVLFKEGFTALKKNNIKTGISNGFVINRSVSLPKASAETSRTPISK